MKLSRLVQSHPYRVLIVGLVVALCLWEWITLAGVLNVNDWSRPTQIAKALWFDLRTPATLVEGDQNSTLTLLPHLVFTLGRFTVGIFAASVIGVAIGFLLGISRLFKSVGHPIVNVLRSMPSAAVWPVIGSILGYNLKSQMFVIIFGTTWPILIYTMNGIGSLRQEVHDGLKFMNIEWYRRWWAIFQWSLPNIFTGLEVGCSIAFLLTITVEYFWPGKGGLGWYLDHSRTAGNDSARLFAGLFLIAGLGWASNTVMHLLRRHFVFWEGDLKEIIHQYSPYRFARVVEKVRDERRRHILVSEYVTKSIEDKYCTEVQPKVLYQGIPYMYPDELKSELGQESDGIGVLQRDITISVPGLGAGTQEVVLFARSWILLSALTTESKKLLEAKILTIGQIVRMCETGCSYCHIRYNERISNKLGQIFNMGGTVHVIQRARLIGVKGTPAIFIEEFVPV